MCMHRRAHALKKTDRQTDNKNDQGKAYLPSAKFEHALRDTEA